MLFHPVSEIWRKSGKSKMILASQLGPVWAHKGSKLVLMLVYNNFMLIDFRGETEKWNVEASVFLWYYDTTNIPISKHQAYVHTRPVQQ